jgi:hypothetical protein
MEQGWLMSFGLWLERSGLSRAVLDYALFSDVIWVGHWFGFFFLVGTSAILNFRLLGCIGRRYSASELADQLLPWTWVGFGIAVLSGFLYFAPSATTFFRSSWFFTKVTLAVLAAASVFVVQRNVRKWDQPAPPPSARITAAVSLLLWIATIVAGTHVPVQTCF